MFMPNYKSIQYVYRGCVLHHLIRLMKDKLLPKESQLILLHCGVGVAAPMEFEKLAVYFQLDTPEITEQYYNEAIQKTRAAIPGSELENWIASYEPVECS
jgi:hypothetical protein